MQYLFGVFFGGSRPQGNLPYIVSGRFPCALSCRRFCRASGSRAFAYGGGCLFLLFYCQASKEDLKAHLAVHPQKNCCVRFVSGRDPAYPTAQRGGAHCVCTPMPIRSSRRNVLRYTAGVWRRSCKERLAVRCEYMIQQVLSYITEKKLRTLSSAFLQKRTAGHIRCT